MLFYKLISILFLFSIFYIRKNHVCVCSNFLRNNSFTNYKKLLPIGIRCPTKAWTTMLLKTIISKISQPTFVLMIRPIITKVIEAFAEVLLVYFHERLLNVVRIVFKSIISRHFCSFEALKLWSFEGFEARQVGIDRTLD